MNLTSSRNSIRIVLLAFAFSMLWSLISSMGNQNRSFGDVREVTPKRAFKSGGARSEIVLQEISATLKRIDQRLERMEKLAERSSSKTEP